MPIDDGCVFSSARTSVEPPGFGRRLGLAEAVGLSLSIVAPTMAMAFNVSLVVRAAGRAAPLAFVIGTVALGIVASSFVSFSKRVAHAGSAYAYIGDTLGWRWGFVAGWTLLLTYLTYAAGVSALIGNFLQAAAQNFGVQFQGLWLVFSLAGLVLAGFCAFRDVKLAGRLMLLLEGFSVLAILFLCAAVLIRVGRGQGLSTAPFIPAADFKGWSGVAYALVFCVLSFAGFEGAATLGEETRNPQRNIPIAILATCVLAGLFYVFVTYAQVTGFGINASSDGVPLVGKGTQMRIDIHTHFQCLDFVKYLMGRTSLPKSLLKGGSYVVQCAAGLSVPSLPKAVDMEEKLRDMEEMKIDAAVLSHGLPFGPDVLRGLEADDWAKRINDDLAGIIDRFPGKFVGLGTIGFGDRQRSIVEANRCIKELGFKGFQIFSNISNKLLDSSEFIPVLKHIGMLGVPIHLHPAIPLNRVGLETASQFLPLGFPYDTSLNTLRLIQSGLFDETPDLNLIVAHIGGVLPYLIGRIGTYSAPSPLVPKASLLKHPIEHYLGRLYVDTVGYHIEALECCYKAIGAEQMLYGTDHPFGRCDVPSALIEQLGCSAPERELIYHGNAERLLNLKQVSVGV